MSARWVKFLFWLFVFVFISTGILSLALSLFYQMPDTVGAKTPDTFLWSWSRTVRPVFGLHMYCWMVMGIIAKQVWEAYKRRESVADWLDPLGIFMPLILSPIVFYPIYSLWTQPNQKVEIVFVLNLTAFQTGFFWQTLLESARLPASK